MHPFGHSTQLRVFVNPDLLQYDPVDEMCGLQRERGMTTLVLHLRTLFALPAVE